MARFTESRICLATEVDETVQEVVRSRARDHVTVQNEGQTVLIAVAITALPVESENFGEDRVLVTCTLGNERRDL